MSQGIDVLHSHSAIEREVGIPKKVVLVDTCYSSLFSDNIVLKSFFHNNKEYIKVPTKWFVRKGGVFLNLDR